MTEKLKILVLSSEVAPFAQVGGLAAAASALPKALARLGHDVRVALPRYRQIDGEKYGLKRVGGLFQVEMGGQKRRVAALESTLPASNVPVYFIWDDRYFHRDGVYGFDDDPQRFAFFGRAVLALIEKLDWQPDVIHCNDWHTALVPIWLDTGCQPNSFFENTATVFSIHNLGYQGIAGRLIIRFAGLDDCLPLIENVESPGQLNFMARGIKHADIISTVSPSYSQQILTNEWGGKLAPLLRSRKDRLIGVIRGLDYDLWNPTTDPNLVSRYDINTVEGRIENKLALLNEMGLEVDEQVPLVGMVTRLVDQKGCDIAGPIVRRLLRGDAGHAYFVLLGLGLSKYHAMFSAIGAEFHEKSRIYLKFDDPLAHRIFAASDIFLMPSLYEPCGTGQMAAMRYGSVPVVRAVGGLADTVSQFEADNSVMGNGFTFNEYDVNAGWRALYQALATFNDSKKWKTVQQHAMSTDFSWDATAPQYVNLYRQAIQLRRG
ncbi:MAG: glycogen synthase [Anaerolineales bacterium]|nr:glycogen synthase [Anaerolineales bacterium]